MIRRCWPSWLMVVGGWLMAEPSSAGHKPPTTDHHPRRSPAPPLPVFQSTDNPVPRPGEMARIPSIGAGHAAPPEEKPPATTGEIPWATKKAKKKRPKQRSSTTPRTRRNNSRNKASCRRPASPRINPAESFRGSCGVRTEPRTPQRSPFREIPENPMNPVGHPFGFRFASSMSFVVDPAIFPS